MYIDRYVMVRGFKPDKTVYSAVVKYKRKEQVEAELREHMSLSARSNEEFFELLLDLGFTVCTMPVPYEKLEAIVDVPINMEEEGW